MSKIVTKTPDRRPGKIRASWLTVMDRARTLRFQFMGIVVASVLVPSFLGGWFASTQINDLLRAQVYSDIEKRTERLAEQISDWLGKRINDVQAFTSSFLLNEEVRKIQSSRTAPELDKSRKNINRYLTYILEDNIHFSKIGILDAEGRLLLKHPPESEDLPWEEIPDPPGASPVIVELGGDELRLLVLQRMGIGGGLASTTFTGVLRSELLESYLRRMAPEGSTAYLFDHEGRIKAANVDLAEDRVAPEGAVKLLANNKARSIYTGLGGQDVIATMASLDDLNWGLVLETSNRDAMKPLTVFRGRVVMMAIILAGLFLVPAILVARTIVLPLEELSRVSRQIRSGKPGLEVKAKAGGELGEFIETFNSMSASLKDSIEEISTMNKRLHTMSITDPLTGRYNRRYIEDYLNRELKLSVRNKQSLTLLMIDLDRFKNYNDTYGHIAGDEALKQVGDILVATLRKTDVVARYGGEEWLVCLNHTNRRHGQRLAEKLRKTVEATVFHLKGEETRITVSIGVATAPRDGSTYEEIMEAADAAMYMAKESGRNQVMVFSGPDPAGASPSAPKGS